ncbi:unnamed protein product [Microthlaspi erraticum]|uniref:Arabidopsis retrotransposon Orf1 C-terminal domain-containing protein n=1 Tax=Microthlaspi erraticum TaxID=1685480 RepID=A0A6D2L752_9BRAS|nr:unnamed protein product [Microthlaspi erraticum]
MVTFRQLEILFGFTMEKVTYGTSRKKNSKEYGLQSLKRGTLPQAHHLTHKDGKKIRGDRAHAGNSCLSLSSSTYKVTAYNTRHQRGRKLSVGGVITPILCAAGVQLDKRRSTPPGWMDIKFCKTNLLIEHKELDGRFQFKFTTIGWTSKLLCPTLSSPQVLGVRTLTSDPLCTH